MPTNRNDRIASLFRAAERKGEYLVACEEPIRQCLARRVNRGSVVRVRQGMYVRAEYLRGLTRAQKDFHLIKTCQSMHPDWVFCHASAGRVYGMPVGYDEDNAVHIATTKATRSPSSAGVKRHVVEGDAQDIMQGIRVTSFERTLFDCMRTASFKRSIALADWVLRMTDASRGYYINAFLLMGRNLDGTWRAIRAMRYADARSESPGESMARAAMIELGFCLPDLQVELPQPLDPSKLYRTDFAWQLPDGTCVLGEFDGMVKYRQHQTGSSGVSMRAISDERKREASLSLYGMPIVRLTYADIMNSKKLSSILSAYRIPRSERIARFEAYLVKKRSTSAQIFTFTEW